MAMLCGRCKKEFDEGSLTPIHPWVGLPVRIIMRTFGGDDEGETKRRYCPRCHSFLTCLCIVIAAMAVLVVLERITSKRWSET
jgi:hypothetical protein